MPFAAAGAIAGIASAGVGIAGALKGSQAAGQGAAQAQALAAQQRNDLMPWVTQGGSALGVTGDLSGANGPDAAQAAMGNFFTSPGYEFRLSEGLRGVDAGAAAKGMLRSGATLKQEMKYGQGLASDEFSNYYSRLFDLSKLGENAAAGGAVTADSAGRLAQAAGNTQSSIYGDLSKGIQTGIKGLGDTLGGTNSLFPKQFDFQMPGFGTSIPGTYSIGPG